VGWRVSLPSFPDLFNWVTHQVGGVAVDAAMAPINALASGIADAVGDMLVTLGTLWIRLGIPDVWHGGTTGPTVEFLHSQVAYFAATLAVLGIIVSAARLAWSQRTEPGWELAEGVFLMVFVTAAGVPMIALATSFADEWSQAIITNAVHGGDFGRNVAEMLKLSGPELAPVLAIMFGFVALVVSAVMVCELAFRAAVLVLLAGLLPVVAAMAVLPGGRVHLKRYGAWVVALVAWKPVAALIYAAAFRMMGARELDASGIGSILIGLTLMTAAVVALPALLRLLTPATGALQSRSHPGPTVQSVAARMPQGAKAVGRVSHPVAWAPAAAQTVRQGPSGARPVPVSPPGAAVPGPPPAPPAEKPVSKPTRRS
jgi:type IV secretion system protein TrbL